MNMKFIKGVVIGTNGKKDGNCIRYLKYMHKKYKEI